ncbi:LysR family transcriptional regulator [Streptomyces sp. NPDC004542]|uniref:LysR family transcriptional regulator n=1 Tax=Streptomyces sp. NPDC004542 TaxID=3154281 RepID=UPI0033BF4537
MTIDELRWFLVLARTQNATRAAELLHITQPTLSRALQRLERRVGVPLFDRRSQRLWLNAYGEVFLAHADRALREIDRATDVIATLRAPQEGTLRLAFLHSLGTWLVPELLGDFGRLDPLVRFVLHQDSADRVARSLCEDTADLVLTSPRPADPLVAWQPLLDEPLVLAVPADHPVAGRTAVRLSEAADERFVAMQSEFGLRQTMDAMFRRRGLTPAVVLESAEIATIHGLVASGLGVAVVPGGPHVTPPKDLVLVPLSDEDAFRTIGLAWHGDHVPALPAQRFRRFVVERFADSP